MANNTTGTAHSYNNSGSGPQNINSGSGRQHNNTGSGHQYIGAAVDAKTLANNSISAQTQADSQSPLGEETPAALKAEHIVDAVGVDDPAVAVALKKAFESYFSGNIRPKLNLRFFSSLGDDLSDEQVVQVQKRFTHIQTDDQVVEKALKDAFERYSLAPPNNRPKLDYRFFAVDDEISDGQVKEVQSRFKAMFPL
uniref:NACHT-NTPase sigma domain-containing protein n=1 Tax=Moniliophthora roreri TaxID=221103 RepID=A0A0W0EYB3_MONRR